MIVLVSLTRKGRAIMLTMVSNSFYSSPSSLPINNKPLFLQTPQHTFFTPTYPTKLYLKQKQFSTSGTHSYLSPFISLSILLHYPLSIDSNCFRFTCFRFCRYYSNLVFPPLPFKVLIKNKTLFLGFNFKVQVQSPICILILFLLCYREGRKRLKK